MSKDGFTLIELLAVIVITTLLVAIVSISVNSIITDYEENLSDVQIKTIEEAANLYYLKEGIKESYKNRSFKLCINLSYLIENDYIEDESIKSIYDNEELNGSVEIIHESEQYTYKYKENSCNYEYEALDTICTAVTEDTKTTGNIPEGNYLPGDEYICKVKKNTEYHFFVISTEGDNVSLIMDRNINSDGTPTHKTIGESQKGDNGGIYNLVEWTSKIDYADDTIYGDNGNNNKGPITAMNYLHNATKDWDNIPNIYINYSDENIVYDTQEKGQTGYEGIETIEDITTITSKDGYTKTTFKNLKARMPKYNEIHGPNKCLTVPENNGQYGSCPLWLSNYLGISEHVSGEGLQNIIDMEGYWIISSAGGYLHSATYVRFKGYVTDNRIVIPIGVRPVITIPKLDIAN